MKKLFKMVFAAVCLSGVLASPAQAAYNAIHFGPSTNTGSIQSDKN